VLQGEFYSPGLSTARITCVFAPKHDSEVFLLQQSDAERENQALSLRVSELKPGIIVDANICSKNGVLLMARGQEITQGAIVRLHSFLATRRLEEPISVIVPRVPVAADAMPPGPVHPTEVN
jgi:hypothetical protein